MRKTYNADITYGVGTEFGFDYLRDNMAYSLADKCNVLITSPLLMKWIVY